MPKIKLNTQAPDFTLYNSKDEPVGLSGFFEKKHVVLIFNRGFI